MTLLAVIELFLPEQTHSFKLLLVLIPFQERWLLKLQDSAIQLGLINNDKQGNHFVLVCESYLYVLKTGLYSGL